MLGNKTFMFFGTEIDLELYKTSFPLGQGYGSELSEIKIN